MNKKSVAVQILTIVPIVSGALLGGFWGGMLTGISAFFFITHAYGLAMIRKAQKEAEFRKKVAEEN